ncbi:2-C-methyl-D-erythritol 4-phosphate cytidylyltransferase [Thauera chlorobenzoica]|uniref:2-C-methyl-D-erythritol 4-phosphate cytidylyltransferase n=1 Tax=Thauera chlorobenzoica TaxID=96773 RepID=A0A1H5YR03_9RHOO|nr:2-C-methyl-D-erythritol 4-phosphate cytidylyltransferase [Thauera chlorobenzoica]APR05482.1 2-C-methyl-D-erythritol 4-phosphate cytidylyltransferase [Thauera chlorobenzoica]SEG26448.1 2-C-methyl-D-erythritol 4-phosphate cytidylyltransferase [Thauera chlorobenzoica]
MQTFHPRHFAIVPAAGSGSRMGAVRPKQYLPLLGRPLIHHALATLCAAPAIDKVFVVLSVDDAEWARHDWSALGSKLVPLFCGGATRADSVLGGLRAIADEAAQSDWVLVHDAARPCLASWHIDKLIRELAGEEVGGLLAVPVADTLKRADEQRHVVETVARDSLWQAQTPQMFRYVMLRRALETAREVTDEASAIEMAGLRPRLVQGDATNLKVTYPLDLHLAEWILHNRRG